MFYTLTETYYCTKTTGLNYNLFVQTDLMMKEKAIRDQIAEKFTLEMKTMEMNFSRKIKEMENDHLTGVTKLKELLERKAKEVDILKEFILSERAKVSQVLESKENEISVLIKEHNELQTECQEAQNCVKEWRLKAERYKDRLSRMSSLEDALKYERENWKQKNTTSAKELKLMSQKITELQATVAQIEQKYEKLLSDHQAAQDKYKNCKKTVFTYKDYMAKKDAHINNEINRMQYEYRKIFLKLQNQLNYYVNCTVQVEKTQGLSSQGQQYQHYDVSDSYKIFFCCKILFMKNTRPLSISSTLTTHLPSVTITAINVCSLAGVVC